MAVEPLSHSGMIARFVGKAFVAAGFILGIYSLTEKQEMLMQTALALLVTGVLASAYGLYHWVTHRSHPRIPGPPGE